MQNASILKESEVLQTPLFLFECRLADGSVEHWATNPAIADGISYRARVLAQNQFEIRAALDGPDSRGTLAITLSNHDAHLSQIENSVGFKGASLSVRFAFFDSISRAPVSDPFVVYLGTADSPSEIGEGYFRLVFRSRLEFSRLLAPQVRIQSRCPWSFPRTPLERQQAVNGGERGRYSTFYRCGYSPDQPDGCGNLDGVDPFVSCDGTSVSCRARGMYSADDNSRPTRRFGGIEFLPPSTLVRSHGDKTFQPGEVQDNAAKYNDFVPVVYGTAWYDPPVIFSRNDGNLTHIEVLLGIGPLHAVRKVIVNDFEIPGGISGANMTGSGWFNIASYGNRTGEFSLDSTNSAGQPIGDPYGSMAVLSVVVPNRVHDGKSTPRIQVLVDGLELPHYDHDGQFTGISFTRNPAWITLDLLRQFGWTEDELDIGSFATVAARCDELTTATGLSGQSLEIPRFEANLVLRKRRSAADTLRGIRFCAGILLRFGLNGKLEMVAEGSFADQQPTKPEGSNSTSPFEGGWAAYEFGDGNLGFGGILRRESGEPSIRFWTKGTAETPNRYSVEFQDAFNSYQQDSLSEVDLDDVLRTCQEISATLPAIGLPHYNQASRILRFQLRRNLEGNLFVEFETSVKALSLRPGDLITLTYLREGFQRSPFRILSIAPGGNFQTARIVAQRHKDDWYSILKTTAPFVAGDAARRSSGSGVPRPIGGRLVGASGQPLFDIEEQTFELTDGNSQVYLKVGFTKPNMPSAHSQLRPRISLSADVTAGAGTLESGQTLYYAVSAITAEGDETGLSFVVPVSLPNSGGPYGIQLKDLEFPELAEGFRVYRGTTAQALSRIADEASLATNFVDAGLPQGTDLPPDPYFDHTNFYHRLEFLPEIEADIFGSNEIGSSMLSMQPNQYMGAAVLITSGSGARQEMIVTSNTSTTLVVGDAWRVRPDPSSRFVVAESMWRFAGATQSDTVLVEIPNRTGMFLQIQGLAANVMDTECPREESPLHRWNIGGSPGNLLDVDIPPKPTFSLLSNRGALRIQTIGFGTFENTRSIAAGTLTLHLWDELEPMPSIQLSADLSAEDCALALAPALVVEGQLIQIGDELVQVTSVEVDGVHEVSRGVYGTVAVGHTEGTKLFPLSRRMFTLPFPREFFGSVASGSYSAEIPAKSCRVVAAEFYVTNAKGNSPTAVALFGDGLRALPGGQFAIQVSGYLAAESNCAPPLIVEEARSVLDIFANVAEPSQGNIELRLMLDRQPYCSLTIPAGHVTSETVYGTALPFLPAKSVLTLDILSIGQGNGIEPGKNLTVTIRL